MSADAFDQDLVVPIEWQAGQDRDDPTGAPDLRPAGAAHHARQVGDPVPVLEGNQLDVRHRLPTYPLWNRSSTAATG